LRPDVVITTGFIPTYLFAFAWAVLHGVPHVAMTDGTAQSEKALSWLHRFVRRIVFARSASFVGACEGSRELFRQYGVPEKRIHLSQLCTDNDRFSRPGSAASADFIFCGRFVSHKRPLFAMEVAKEVAKRLGRRTMIDFVGSGAMEPEMRDYAAQIADFVDTRFHGYVTQDELPSRYADARIFLFPSEWDPWGVVANEACAAGLPVIVSPHAGAAGELVLDGSNGYIRELDVAQWTEAAVGLLSDDVLYSHFSKSGRERVADYTFDHAARGLAKAITQAYHAHKAGNIQAVAK
jgi:glycosyltransferase involved in cell wall biosynthesis